MKLYSKDGQALVNVTDIEVVGGELKMQAKLMNAYSTEIYLTPYELFHAKDLLKKGMIKKIWKMYKAGKTAEPKKESGFTFAD